MEKHRPGRPTTHGLSVIRRHLSTLTTKRLDGRSAMARAVREWRAEVAADLGGDLSRAQETLVELAARTWLLVSSLDDWLGRQPSLVSARKRSVIPVVLQRQQLVDSLARTLERLGLERRPKPIETPLEYAARKDREKAAAVARGGVTVSTS